MEHVEVLIDLLDELRDLNQTQTEINQTLKVMARSEIEQRLSHIFDGSDEILVYQLSDGDKSSSEIAKYVGVSGTTIARLWNRWEEEFGIVETAGYRKPYRAKSSLEELALLFGKPPINGVAQAEDEE